MELKSLRTGASLIDTMPLLSRKLLNEKNEEIDQLTKELGELHEYVSQLERGVLSNVSHAKFIIYVFFFFVTVHYSLPFHDYVDICYVILCLFRHSTFKSKICISLSYSFDVLIKIRFVVYNIFHVELASFVCLNSVHLYLSSSLKNAYWDYFEMHACLIIRGYYSVYARNKNFFSYICAHLSYCYFISH